MQSDWQAGGSGPRTLTSPGRAGADLLDAAFPPHPASPEPCFLDGTETTVRWGEDTRCTACLCALPAGAPAWADDDGTLCADCAGAEGAA